MLNCVAGLGGAGAVEAVVQQAVTGSLAAELALTTLGKPGLADGPEAVQVQAALLEVADRSLFYQHGVRYRLGRRSLVKQALHKATG